jgi:hypothetical protein
MVVVPRTIMAVSTAIIPNPISISKCNLLWERVVGVMHLTVACSHGGHCVLAKQNACDRSRTVWTCRQGFIEIRKFLCDALDDWKI